MKQFAEKHQILLKLNVTKCEIVAFTRKQGVLIIYHSVLWMVWWCNLEIQASHGLGFWWKGDLSSSKSIEENISKARQAFFHLEALAFFAVTSVLYHQDLSWRHVSRIPILLYGSENWILMENLLKKLESFQGELAKRILKWPINAVQDSGIKAWVSCEVAEEG